MAWICLGLEGTLLTKDEETGEDAPMEGAPEAMQQLVAEGHRLTVWTARFKPMPASRHQQLRQELEQQLQAFGFPPIEVWGGTTKPPADLFIDNRAITFDGDWGLALAQTQSMLEDRGLAPGPQPFAAERMSLGPEEEAEEGDVPE